MWFKRRDPKIKVEYKNKKVSIHKKRPKTCRTENELQSRVQEINHHCNPQLNLQNLFNNNKVKNSFPLAKRS